MSLARAAGGGAAARRRRAAAGRGGRPRTCSRSRRRTRGPGRSRCAPAAPATSRPRPSPRRAATSSSPGSCAARSTSSPRDDLGWLLGLTHHLTERASLRRREQLGVDAVGRRASCCARSRTGRSTARASTAALEAAGVRADGQRMPHLLAAGGGARRLVLGARRPLPAHGPARAPATATRRSPRSPAATCAATARRTPATSPPGRGSRSATPAPASPRSPDEIEDAGDGLLALGDAAGAGGAAPARPAPRLRSRTCSAGATAASPSRPSTPAPSIRAAASSARRWSPTAASSAPGAATAAGSCSSPSRRSRAASAAPSRRWRSSVPAMGADPQPLWALVPPAHRARYLRRAARAVLDDLEGLAALLAEESGQPRTEATLAELLPSVGGLHGLADDGPKALADRRLGKVPALRAGRRSTLVQAPLGTVGIVVRDGSAWAGPLLEAAAALLAGNAVRLEPAAPRAAVRLQRAFARAGLPDGLLGARRDRRARARRRARPAAREGHDAAARGRAARPGGHGRAVGRVRRRRAAAGRGRPGDRAARPGARARRRGRGRRAAAPRGRPARSRDGGRPARERGGRRAGGGARRGGRARRRDAAVRRAGRGRSAPTGAFYAPVVLRGVPPGAALLASPSRARCSPSSRRPTRPRPIALAAGAAAAPTARPAGPPARSRSGPATRGPGERVARALGAPIAWINEHGVASPAAPVRLARYVQPRQLASQPTRLRSARWLPYDPALVRAATATAQLVHGREADRWPALQGQRAAARAHRRPARPRGAGPLGRRRRDHPQLLRAAAAAARASCTPRRRAARGAAPDPTRTRTGAGSTPGGARP